MIIVGHFGYYSAAYEYAQDHNLKNYSIQHLGQGWQKYKWCLLILPRKK